MAMRSFLTFVAVVACMISMRATADLACDHSGNLFVSAASTNNAIVKFAADGTKSTFATGIEGALAFDAAGNLFVGVSDATGTIFKLAPDGTKSTFAEGVGNPVSLAFDPAGNLYAYDLESGSIFKFTPNGDKSTFAKGTKPPGQMFANNMVIACDRAGNLFAADSESDTILKFAPDGTRTTFATKVKATKLAFDKVNNLLAANFWSKDILKFSPDGAKSTLRTALNAPEGLAVDSAGNLFVYDAPYTIFKFTPNGTKSTFAQNRPEPVADASEGAQEAEPGADSSAGLPKKYAKDYLIAGNTISRDKKFAVIYPNEAMGEAASEKELKNYLVALQPFSILRPLDTTRPYFQHQSHGGLSAEWSDDSSVGLITLDSKWGPGDVLLVEFRNGRLSRMTNILRKAHDLLGLDYRKAKAERYNDYYDFVFMEDASFELDGTRQVVINAQADTTPNDLGLSSRAWHGRVDATWDIRQAKFTSSEVSGRKRGADAYRNRGQSAAEEKKSSPAQDVQKAIGLTSKGWDYYLSLAWYYLFDRKPREAIAASLKALGLSPRNAAMIKVTLAHSYLFDNQFDKAKAIYLENKNAKLRDDDRTFSQAVLDDFKELEEAGVTNPDVEKIKALLTSETDAR
jgi:sugar lactone lactonase YvrE